MLRNWAEIDGQLAAKGIPGLLTLSARRGLNAAYYWIVRYMKEEERKDFDASLNKTWEEALVEATELAIYEELQRQKTIRQLAEVAQ